MTVKEEIQAMINSLPQERQIETTVLIDMLHKMIEKFPLAGKLALGYVGAEESGQ